VTTIEESKDLEEIKIEELLGSLQTYDLSLPPIKKVKTIALQASKKKAKISSEEDSEKEKDAMAMLAKYFGRLMRNDRFKKKFFERLKKAPESLNLKMLRRRTQEAPDVLNAQVLGLYGLTVGTSSRKKGRPTMRLSVMSPKKKKLLLKINF
jgi:hypothetical protein